MKLTVIVPAYNEESSVAEVVTGVPEDISGVTEVETIVVDDGSVDSTPSLAQEAGATVISTGTNRGLGTAFSIGIDQALRSGADIIVNIDADGQFNPADIPELIAPIQNNSADLVTCTRFSERRLRPAMSWKKRWGNRFITAVINQITNLNPAMSDVSCGFRAYSRDAALRLNLFGYFTYTHETIIDAAAKGLRIREMPLSVQGERSHGRSRMAHSLWRYGKESGLILLRSARDLHPFRFFGAIGLVLLLAGLACGGFVYVHWLYTGHTTPYQSLLLGSGVFLILAFLMFVVALLADMLGRVRKTLDNMLYLTRRKEYARDSHADNDADRSS